MHAYTLQLRLNRQLGLIQALQGTPRPLQRTCQSQQSVLPAHHSTIDNTAQSIGASCSTGLTQHIPSGTTGVCCRHVGYQPTYMRIRLMSLGLTGLTSISMAYTPQKLDDMITIACQRVYASKTPVACIKQQPCFMNTIPASVALAHSQQCTFTSQPMQAATAAPLQWLPTWRVLDQVTHKSQVNGNKAPLLLPVHHSTSSLAAFTTGRCSCCHLLCSRACRCCCPCRSPLTWKHQHTRR